MNQPISGGGAPGAPGAPGTPVAKDNKQALWSLILGILGIVCCGLLAPVAWYMGRKEVQAVDAGQSAQENRGMAMAGMVLGIVGTVLLILTLLWLFLAGGIGMLGALSDMQ